MFWLENGTLFGADHREGNICLKETPTNKQTMNTLKHLFMLDHWSNAHRKWNPLLLCGGRNAVIETTCVVETSSANIYRSLSLCMSVFFTSTFPNPMALPAYARVSSKSENNLNCLEKIKYYL